VSFASEPERDDGSLPPVNIVVPDDARELDRDVLAYRREVRAQRRRQRRLRLLRPFSRPGIGGPAAIVPLIALCLALALVGGALLSVVTISPALAPTTSATPQESPRPSDVPSGLITLPKGDVRLDGKTVQVRSLFSSVIALVPKDCGCGQSLSRVAGLAITADVPLYFVSAGAPIAQLNAETNEYGQGHAQTAVDAHGLLAAASRPKGLTLLLVFRDATAQVIRDLSGNFQLEPLSELKSPGAKASASASAPATADATAS
jgi:hypothetical protein